MFALKVLKHHIELISMVQTCKSSYSSGISLRLSVSVKNQPRTEKNRSANTTKSHWIFSDITVFPLHCGPCNYFNWIIFRVSLLERNLSFGDLSSTTNTELRMKRPITLKLKNLTFSNVQCIDNHFHFTSHHS